MQTARAVRSSAPFHVPHRAPTAPPLTVRRAVGGVLALWAAVAALLTVAVLVILRDLWD